MKLQRAGWALPLAFFALSAWASPRSVSEFMSLMDKVRSSVTGLSGPTATTYCREVSLGISNSQNAECYRTYRNFYQNSQVNIHFALGYGDTRPKNFVRDHLIAVALRRQLTAPCVANYFSCGFTQTDDGDVLEKTITGPDNRPKTIRLTLSSSSLFQDDDINRDAAHIATQTARSARVRKEFQQALSNADAVFYLGHSRSGGGPDFSPPMLDAEKHPNYPAYRAAQTGLSDILNNVNQPPRKLKLLGMFSCGSHDHFYDKIHAAAPGLGMVTTNNIITDRTLIQGALGSLNSLVGMQCQQSMASGVDTGKHEVGVHNFMGL